MFYVNEKMTIWIEIQHKTFCYIQVYNIMIWYLSILQNDHQMKVKP